MMRYLTSALSWSLECVADVLLLCCYCVANVLLMMNGRWNVLS